MEVTNSGVHAWGCRRRAVALTAALVAAASGWFATAFAADAATVTDFNNEIGISLSVLQLFYAESGTEKGGYNGLLDTDTGATPGIGVRLSALRDLGGFHDLFVRLDYQFNQGTVDHRDYNVSLEYGAGLTVNDVDFEIGKAFHVRDDLLLIPVAQVEYRNWSRLISMAILNPKEDYTFIAPGAALRGTWSFAPNFALKTKFGIESMTSADVSGPGTPAQGYPPVNWALGHKFVFQVQAGVDAILTGQVHAFFDVTYSRFAFGHGPSTLDSPGGVIGSEHEPNSVSNQIYVQAGLALGF